jgi:hypothetical protein
MAGLFANYRSEHHPDPEWRLRIAIAYLRREIDAAQVQRLLRRRDRLLWLEMESSSLAGILIEPFLHAFPARKFILTLRDAYSWCDSWIDHNINSPPGERSPWAELDRVRLRVGEFSPTRYDAPLSARGCAPLACYFQLWASHNTRVLETVPAQQLLIVKTAQIRANLADIAAWAGVAPETLRAERSWLFAAPAKHRVLASLDPDYVQDTAERFCAPLLRQYFADLSPQRSPRA